MFLVGPAVHALFGAAGAAVVASRNDAGVPNDVVIATEAIDHQLIEPGFMLALAGMLLGSLLFSGAIVTGRTLYPRAMACVCPLALLLAAAFATRPVPAPIGGYLFVAAIHLATPLFFGIPLVWWIRRAAQHRR